MNEQLKKLENFLTTVIQHIVKHPDKIKLNFSDVVDDDDNETTLVSIKVATEDIPICIGAGGTVAESIRRLTILACRQIGYDKRIFVRVDAPKMPKNHFDFNN